MKIRNGFVTNSSSSSFVLAFQDDAELENFKSRAAWDSQDIINLVVRSMGEINDEDAKTRALRIVEWARIQELVDEKFKESPYESLDDYFSARDAFRHSEECAAALEQDADYQAKIKRLQDAQYISEGVIWDSDGGLMEWAIRNGYFEKEFPDYTLLVWNVG